MNSQIDTQQTRSGKGNGMPVLSLLLHWLVVGLPLAWGILETLKKSLALFR